MAYTYTTREYRFAKGDKVVPEKDHLHESDFEGFEFLTVSWVEYQSGSWDAEICFKELEDKVYDPHTFTLHPSQKYEDRGEF